MKKNNFKEWTKYDNSMILEAGLYYVVIDAKEVKSANVYIHNGYHTIKVLQYVNTIPTSEVFQINYDGGTYTRDYDNEICEYCENSFLIPPCTATKNWDIKYIKKCTESFKRFKDETKTKYIIQQYDKIMLCDESNTILNDIRKLFLADKEREENNKKLNNALLEKECKEIEKQAEKQTEKTWQLYDSNTKLDNGLYYAFIYTKKDKHILHNTVEIEVGGCYTLKLIERATLNNKTYNINYFDYMHRVSDCMQKTDFILDEQLKYKIVMYKKLPQFYENFSCEQLDRVYYEEYNRINDYGSTYYDAYDSVFDTIDSINDNRYRLAINEIMQVNINTRRNSAKYKNNTIELKDSTHFTLNTQENLPPLEQRGFYYALIKKNDTFYVDVLEYKHYTFILFDNAEVVAYQKIDNYHAMLMLNVNFKKICEYHLRKLKESAEFSKYFIKTA